MRNPSIFSYGKIKSDSPRKFTSWDDRHTRPDRKLARPPLGPGPRSSTDFDAVARDATGEQLQIQCQPVLEAVCVRPPSGAAVAETMV